jgi:hypothetical protein
MHGLKLQSRIVCSSAISGTSQSMCPAKLAALGWHAEEPLVHDRPDTVRCRGAAQVNGPNHQARSRAAAYGTNVQGLPEVMVAMDETENEADGIRLCDNVARDLRG